MTTGTNATVRESERANEPVVPYAAAKSFTAGAISGAIAKTAVAPFDRFVFALQPTLRPVIP